LEATVHVEGLPMGGVFTFWWVVRQGDPANAPFDWFVANGGGAVIAENGRATVHMSANIGQTAIEGMPFLPPGTGFSPLTDPHGAVVRVEIAYHGQVAEAGGNVEAWLADFWTGAACPASGTNIGGQPFCPVYVAAQHNA
jgi:hypothetical protein